MPCTPDEILGIAQLLCAENTEVGDRSAASRAYYAALHTTSATFERTTPEVNGENSHVEIIKRAQAYGNSRAPGFGKAFSIANALFKLKGVRKAADYRLANQFPEQLAEEALERAKKIMRLCDEVAALKSPPVVASRAP